VDERARRRCREVVARGEPVEYCAVLDSVQRRDVIDSGRTLAPLRPADDAVVIDTTPLSVDQVLGRVLALVDGYCEKG
jgi:cytidylate kinase